VGEWGITPAAQVVVYDRQGGMYAARAWWMLRWLGHDAVALLDGGLAAWQASGGKVESGEAASRPAAPPYPLAAPRVGTVDASQLALGIAPRGAGRQERHHYRRRHRAEHKWRGE